MASFWSDRLVEFIAGTTDVTDDVPAITSKAFEDEIVEEGKAFIVYVNNDSLASGTSQFIYIKTPVATHRCRMSVSVVTNIEAGVNPNKTALADIHIYESPTVTDIGTDTKVLIANINRENGESPLFTIKGDPTITANGTMITDGLILAGVSTARPDLILKPDTEYLLEIHNRGTVASLLSWNFIMYQLEQ